jgi:hypothetical protein
LSVAPTAGYTVQPGSNYKLKSAASDFSSGAGFFYFNNGRKLVFTGCRGKVSMSLATAKPVEMAFDFDAMGAAETVATVGYTPSINTTRNPPICLGVTTYIYYSGAVTGTPSTTSVPLTSTVPLDALAGDILIVDTSATASPTWETKTVGTWTDATQTVTCSALTAAPTVGHSAYIRRSVSLPPISTLKIDVTPKWDKVDAMIAAYGVAGMIPTSRIVAVAMDKYYRSTLDKNMRDNVIGTELWAIVGSTAGNIGAICIPRFVPKVADIKIADLMGLTVSGEAYATSGNDSIFMALL